MTESQQRATTSSSTVVAERMQQLQEASNSCNFFNRSRISGSWNNSSRSTVSTQLLQDFCIQEKNSVGTGEDEQILSDFAKPAHAQQEQAQREKILLHLGKNFASKWDYFNSLRFY